MHVHLFYYRLLKLISKPKSNLETVNYTNQDVSYEQYKHKNN